ncbi:MAG: UDP-N-acetylglucosamine 2-epimerase (hydrolyzing) [Candidatus Diapherotrites archaeon]|nr:UDP-N-acetylglucosamine 2-epimerase (hydrolyzing) [Candidatus Diapherotrites archaeon]
MRKICIVTGNRSEYSRLKSVMQEIKNRPDLELFLIVTASHMLDDFGKTINTIKENGFNVDCVARTIAAGEDPASMAKSLGLCALELPTLFEINKPDVLLIVGDRFDVLGAVTSAALMNIPIAHIQGGEVTGTIDESIRHAITKLSHIHFAATEKSAERVRKMGEKKEHVFNVGCPSADIIKNIELGTREEICEKYRMNPKKPFLILAQHPVTTEYNEVKHQIRETLSAIHELGIQTIMLYPNVDAGSKDSVAEIRKFDMAKKLEHTNKFKHIFFEDFIKLLANAACIVGNSSSGIRESCYFGTPAVNIGTRQNSRERGKNVTDVGYDKEEIKKAILSSIEHGKYKPEYVYGDGGSGKKIAEILAEIDLKGITQKKIML